jgi:Rieske Fe-S protein
MTAGAVGALGALVASSAGQLVPPPRQFGGEIREQLHYTKFPTPQWWNPRAGRPVRVADFDTEWLGATGVWRGLFSEGSYVPGTGLPVLVVRVKRDPVNFREPAPAEYPPGLPEGFSLYHDDPANDVRIVVLFDRCVHLCCYPGWHVVVDPPPARDYSVYTTEPPPTWEVYRQDPIYCVCHGSQYEPMRLVVNFNEKAGANYIGAERVHGPAHRALPVVPVKVQSGTLVGGMPDPRWYVFCA